MYKLFIKTLNYAKRQSNGNFAVALSTIVAIILSVIPDNDFPITNFGNDIPRE
ncbi:MAG: hypothetical protein LBT79_03060 [Elusimicrobiota bacterium]|jgi:hypothetical protein|nr:hypothetical protein [Elusimicrobiota bacterium]